MSSFRLPWLASLALIAVCWEGGQARAGDFEDCTGPLGDKTAAACTTVLDDVQRSAEDRVKAYIARSRFSTGRGKFDAGLADAEAALALNPQSVWAFVARAYARQRSGKLDAALADYSRAIELEPKNPQI
jgi:Tfp pilus assembly protein PilF